MGVSHYGVLWRIVDNEWLGLMTYGLAVLRKEDFGVVFSFSIPIPMGIVSVWLCNSVLVLVSSAFVAISMGMTFERGIEYMG